MSDIYTIAVHIKNVLAERRGFATFALAFAFFTGLFAFFFGLFTIPLPKGPLGFYRMESPMPFDYFYIGFSSLVSALIATLTFYRARLKMTEAETLGTSVKTAGGNAASFLGIATGVLGTVCPACLGINLLLLGNVFTAQVAFLIPYIFWIQLCGIALLLLGLYLVARSSYEKKCISCRVEDGQGDEDEKDARSMLGKMLVGSAIALLMFQVSFAWIGAAPRAEKNSIVANGEIIDIDAIVEEVTPAKGFATNVRWGDVVSKMVATGALDPQKLETILTKQYGQEMKPEWRAVLAGEDVNLEINNENAVFMMYMLWTLGKHNQNQILSDSPIAKYFNKYDIGVGRVGYGDTPILSLTAGEQAVAKKVAENAYRPCCGNATASPDCSHGFAALGLIELMASQGMSEAEMFDTFVKFNSFWFPETYIKDALYFRSVRGEKWSEADKKLIAGVEYSSISGAYKVKNYLAQNFGI